jgi:hypothetical protein
VTIGNVSAGVVGTETWPKNAALLYCQKT